MRTIVKYTGMIGLLLGLCACSDLMDKGPLDKISEEAIWSDLNLAEDYVNDQYRVLPNVYRGDFIRAHHLSCFTDECSHKYGYYGVTDYYRGAMSPSITTSLDCWSYHYGYIRGCNIFLKNVDRIPAVTNADKAKLDRLKGEILFLRAWNYFDLAARYGGVVKLTEPFELKDDFARDRSSFEEIVEFVISDLNEATALLPESYSDDKDFGRLTKGAAMGLKSRMLLYAASPLFNKSNDKSKWEAAARATKEMIDYAERTGLYELYGDKDTYKELFMSMKNKEMIITSGSYQIEGNWYFCYQEGVGGGTDGYNYSGGWSTMLVNQRFVDQFEMIDGTPFDWNNPAHATDPYANRDPRLYVDVTIEGSKWYSDSIVQFWICEKNNNFTLPQYKNNVFTEGLTPGFEADEEVYGRNSVANPNQKGNTPETNYLYRKQLDPFFNVDTEIYPYNTTWFIMRYAEILLNYAEAVFETGNEPEALIYLNKIRRRVGMPDVTGVSGDALRKKIQHERQIELCFETHRFFDARRWLIAEEEFSKPIYGISIVKDKNSDQKIYTPFKFQDRVWPAQYYLQPIPTNEIQRTNLTQNSGY